MCNVRTFVDINKVAPIVTRAILASIDAQTHASHKLKRAPNMGVRGVEVGNIADHLKGCYSKWVGVY